MAIQKIVDAVRDVTVVDATKLTGSIDATNLTGSIDAARVPAGAVTQHVQATDLTAVHQAIATLGLHTAVSDNKAAFNLPNAFIDTFEDDTGIATETTTDRNASEYVSTVSGSIAYVTGDRSSAITVTSSGITIGGGTVPNLVEGSGGSVGGGGQDTSTGFYWTAQTPSAGAYVRFQFGTATKVTEIKWFTQTAAVDGTFKWQGSNDASSWTDLTSSFVHQGVVTGSDWIITSDLSSNTNTYTYYQMLWVSGALVQLWQEEVEFKEDAQVANATGTLVSTVQTAPSATTEVSGVILYTDEEGTNTLGSSDELAIYLTANLQGTTPNWTGTNWTEAASYGTPQTFSGTTKQVKLGKTTVTSGTQVAMKAVWANQAATVAGSQSAVGHATGTTIGDFSTNTAEAFNGTTNVASGSAARSASLQEAWIGKDWGSGNTKTITGFKAYAPNNDGLHGNGGSSSGCTMTLYGNSTNNTGTAVALGGLTNQNFHASPWSQTYEMLSGLTTTTAYRYHWLKLTTSATANNFNLAEAVFYTTSAGTSGKVAQLNGWAVNY